MLLCILVVLLYLSRVIYNLVAVTVPHDVSSFGFGWINVSDEVNHVLLNLVNDKTTVDNFASCFFPSVAKTITLFVTENITKKYSCDSWEEMHSLTKIVAHCT